MNAYITIGFNKDNKAKVICQPNIPYKEQKAIFHKLEKDYAYVEIWSKSSGIVKRKRIKEKELKKADKKKVDKK